MRHLGKKSLPSLHLDNEQSLKHPNVAARLAKIEEVRARIKSNKNAHIS